MSVSGISATSLFSLNTQSVQNKSQQFRKEFQQLGQDLQSGNLSAAQADFTALQQSGPLANASSSSQSNSPIAQAFQQLAKDLQSGNVSAAQQDYTTIQQDFQKQATQGHHHHHGGSGSDANTISQIVDQLGQALQSGNLTAAQQAYTTLQQDLQQFAQNRGSTQQATTQTGSQGVSVNA